MRIFKQPAILILCVIFIAVFSTSAFSAKQEQMNLQEIQEKLMTLKEEYKTMWNMMQEADRDDSCRIAQDVQTKADGVLAGISALQGSVSTSDKNSLDWYENAINTLRKRAKNLCAGKEVEGDPVEAYSPAAAPSFDAPGGPNSPAGDVNASDEEEEAEVVREPPASSP